MGITSIYNRYECIDEKREALEAWVDCVDGLVDRNKSGGRG